MLVARMGRYNAVVFPVILIVILAFVGLVFMRNTPQERGINPDNVSDEEYRNEYFNEKIDEDGGWTVKKLFSKKHSGWLQLLPVDSSLYPPSLLHSLLFVTRK